MARIARVVLPGIPHHVTQRGNGLPGILPDAWIDVIAVRRPLLQSGTLCILAGTILLYRPSSFRLAKYECTY